MKTPCCPTCGRPLPPEEEKLPALTPIEYRIYMAAARNGLASPGFLVAAVWGEDYAAKRKTLHVHVNNLNKKLATMGIRLRAGRGRRQPYRFVAEAAE